MRGHKPDRKCLFVKKKLELRYTDHTANLDQLGLTWLNGRHWKIDKLVCTCICAWKSSFVKETGRPAYLRKLYCCCNSTNEIIGWFEFSYVDVPIAVKPTFSDIIKTFEMSCFINKLPYIHSPCRGVIIFCNRGFLRVNSLTNPQKVKTWASIPRKYVSQNFV